jgi:hypothetical protein
MHSTPFAGAQGNKVRQGAGNPAQLPLVTPSALFLWGQLSITLELISENVSSEFRVHTLGVKRKISRPTLSF